MKDNTNIKAVFAELEKLLKKLVAAKQTFQGELTKLDKQADTYLPEVLAKRKEKAQSDYEDYKVGVFNDFKETADKLRNLVVERHQTLDLANPTLQNATRLIELIGSNMDGDLVRQINSQFVGDQQSLRVLQQIYRAKGFQYDGDLESQIYDIEAAFERLDQVIVSAYQSETNLNTLASTVGKIATFEGVEFAGEPDPEAFMESLRRGAAGEVLVKG